MKASVPAAEGENHDRIRAGDLLVLSKVAAHQGLNPEGRQPVGAHEKPHQVLPTGLTAAVEIVGPSRLRDLFEGLTVFSQR